EDNLGALQPGKLADLVVLDRDYLTIPADQIKDIKPVLTMVDGRIVYDGSSVTGTRSHARTVRPVQLVREVHDCAVPPIAPIALFAPLAPTTTGGTMPLRRLLLAALVLTIPVYAFAQEAVLTGTITDATGAVLPGVTVTVLHEASGNRFVAVTDERGVYSLPARVGAYQIAAELQGFSTAQRNNIELLVGQTLVINLQLAPSGVAENVTVTGEAPLINVATSQLGGNIDPQQVQEVPVRGSYWMAPGH